MRFRQGANEWPRLSRGLSRQGAAPALRIPYRTENPISAPIDHPPDTVAMVRARKRRAARSTLSRASPRPVGTKEPPWMASLLAQQP
jgi:hypothetical protein